MSFFEPIRTDVFYPLMFFLILPFSIHAHSEPQAVVVAVIDTGIDIHHPQFKNKLWQNQGESGVDEQGRQKCCNNLDDDQNGYIDDVNGYNFANQNNQLWDSHGHGTHIAGIINSIAPTAKLMILKYYDAKAREQDNLKNTIEAIEYAILQNAKIINYSGGGSSFSKKEFLVIQKAREKGIVMLAAAGNEKANSDFYPFYPADYDLPNIISVAAINGQNRVIKSSNYGVKSVDLAAPGENILAAAPGGGFTKMTGTSQATAYVSGIAARVMTQFAGHTSERDLIRALTLTNDLNPHLLNKTKYARTVDTNRALTVIDESVSAFHIRVSNEAHIESENFKVP